MRCGCRTCAAGGPAAGSPEMRGGGRRASAGGAQGRQGRDPVARALRLQQRPDQDRAAPEGLPRLAPQQPEARRVRNAASASSISTASAAFRKTAIWWTASCSTAPRRHRDAPHGACPEGGRSRFHRRRLHGRLRDDPGIGVRRPAAGGGRGAAPRRADRRAAAAGLHGPRSQARLADRDRGADRARGQCVLPKSAASPPRRSSCAAASPGCGSSPASGAPGASGARISARIGVRDSASLSHRASLRGGRDENPAAGRGASGRRAAGTRAPERPGRESCCPPAAPGRPA